MKYRAKVMTLATTAAMLTATFASHEALAQETMPSAASPAETQDSADAMPGDIIVTAQKRSERLLDVPMSVTAATGDALLTRGIRSAEQLETVVPGFTFQKNSYGAPVFTLRGVGIYNLSSSVSPAVSVYVDQTPLPYAAMAQGAALDLERVEVLKGPQGTLFGQNSTGGAINYIAAKPSDELSVGANLEYGRFNTVNAQAFVGGPLSSSVRARVFMNYDYRDPWQKPYLQNDARFGRKEGDELGRRRFFAGRVLLDWDASAALTLRLNLNGWRDRSDNQAAQFVQFIPGVPANPFNQNVFQALGPLGPTPENARLAGWDTNRDLSRDASFYQAGLTANLDLGATTLTSISAYQRYRSGGYVDIDGTAFANFANDPRDEIKVFSQELRLSGQFDRFRWVVGGNYAHDDAREDWRFVLNSANSTVGPFTYNSLITTSNQKVDTYAAFVSGEYAITDQLDVQGALRYTKQDREFDGCLADDGDGRLAAGFAGGFGVPAVPGGCVTLASPTPPFSLAGAVQSSLNEDNVSWRASLNWKPQRDVLLYASVARGYKSGAYTNVPAVFAIQVAPARQESVLAYEAGFKMANAARTLELTGAAFYYDYADKQILGGVAVPLFGNLPQLVNVPQSRVVGGEMSMVARPYRGITITAGGSLVDSKVQRNPAVPLDGLGRPTNFVGQSFPGTPRWQGNIDAEYRFAAGAMDVFVGATATARTHTQSAVLGEIPEFRVPGYTLVDLRAGVELPGERWRVQLWGRNVTNRFYILNIDRRTDALARTVGLPATYGVSLSYRFNR